MGIEKEEEEEEDEDEEDDFPFCECLTGALPPLGWCSMHGASWYL